MSILNRRQQNLFDAACEYIDTIPQLEGYRLIATGNEGWLYVYLFKPLAKVERCEEDPDRLTGWEDYTPCIPPVLKVGAYHGQEIQEIKRMINRNIPRPDGKTYKEHIAGDDPMRRSYPLKRRPA